MPHAHEIILVVLRFAPVIGWPAFHHFFDKTAEHGIHVATHKIGLAKWLVNRCKFAPDVAMILIILLCDLVIDHFVKE